MGVGVADAVVGGHLVVVFLDGIGVFLRLQHIVQSGVGHLHVGVAAIGQGLDFLGVALQLGYVVGKENNLQEELLLRFVALHVFGCGPKGLFNFIILYVS